MTCKNSMRPYRTCGSGGSCGRIFKLFSARCFLQKYGRSDPLAQNRWKSLYYRSKSMKIDKKRCTLVFFLKNRWKSLYYRSKSMAFDTFSIKNNHSVAEVPPKVEKTWSENTTFANSVHLYRTSGSLAGAVDFWRSSPMSIFRSNTCHSVAEVA